MDHAPFLPHRAYPIHKILFMHPIHPTVFIPALLCDERLYRNLIFTLGGQVDAQVLMSPLPSLADSVRDILARAPAKFVLAGTSYGGNLALEIAFAAPERVTALWLMGCDPGAPPAGGPDLATGLESTPEAVIDKLAAVVVHPQATAAAQTFKAMARTVGAAAGAAQARALRSREAQAARFGGLTMPTLVLWGADDALVPCAVGRQMAVDLPRAQFHELKRCGHLPTLEKPAESAAIFSRFLSGMAAARR